MSTTEQQKKHYHDLELLPQCALERQPQCPNMVGKIRSTWLWLVDALTTDLTLQIWKSSDSDQAPSWYIYNPEFNSLRKFDSEYEAVAYLEDYYGVNAAETLRF